MIISVVRNKKTSDGVFGKLSIDTHPFTCFTCENLNQEIPVGIYRITFDRSNRFNRIMPHIWVPVRDAAAVKAGFEDAGIRIHWGNKPSNYEGCLGVGDSEEPDAIDNTVATFNKLYAIISAQTDLTIRIEEAYA